MKVFLSWSGSLSHQIACVFREWLPNVLQYVDAYVSSEDIDKGTRWSTDIAKELEESFFGIIFVTKDNIEAPWIAFEAGALSKMLDKSNVAPFLFNLRRSELSGPLLQFQSTVFNKEDIFKLLISINKNATQENQLDDERIKRIFEKWWPDLESNLETIAQKSSAEIKEKPVDNDNTLAILEEILELARYQQRTISTPELLLPKEFLLNIFDMAATIKLSSSQVIADETIHDVQELHYQVEKVVKIIDFLAKELKIDTSNALFSELGETVRRIQLLNYRLIAISSKSKKSRGIKEFKFG